MIPSIEKEYNVFCNVKPAVKSAILNLMPFEEGVLPVHYLGVPLITTRLHIKECQVLVERIKNRIRD